MIWWDLFVIVFVGVVLVSLFGVLSYTFCLVLFCLGDLVLICSFATLWFVWLFGLDAFGGGYAGCLDLMVCCYSGF